MIGRAKWPSLQRSSGRVHPNVRGPGGATADSSGDNGSTGAAMTPAVGQVVRLRSRQYLVEAVEPPPLPGQQTTVRLSCLDDDAQGVPLDVLWERELDAEVVNAASWKAVAQRGFDEPRMFAAYLHAQRWNCVTSTNARLFQAPYRAGIDVKSYQLEPLRKALELPRVNLFIADDVGLGKTIEAGLILRELLMRQKVRRVVVSCPPSVVLQWRDELDQRFGLRFEVFDRDYVSRRRREQGFGVNPWRSHTRFIISHALLREEEYAAPLRDWLDVFCPGSLLILDEAHHAAPSSGSKYAIDSKFTKTVRTVAERFEHRLFLSATPHNGHSNSFTALLEILDPQRFVRGTDVGGKGLLDAVMVRRLKSDLRDALPGTGFCKRVVQQIDIEGLAPSDPELQLPQLLEQYRTLRESRLEGQARSVQNAAGLVGISLQKRLLSSIEAFRTTLAVHSRAMEKAQGAATPAPVDMQLSLLAQAPGNDDDDEERDEDEVAEEEAAETEAATAMTAAFAALDERNLLKQMAELADEAHARPDARVKKLSEWIRSNLVKNLPVDGADRAVKLMWEKRRVIIFTEYTDTKRYLVERLTELFALHADPEIEDVRAAWTKAERDGMCERIAVFHGGIGEERREEIKRAFNADPDEHPLRILIATDAAREGVNLQNHCSDLFHFDVPWNPSRMEQRNGRIDRIGQRAAEVRCHYFVYRQREEDEVLEALVKKTETIREELGSLGQVLEHKLAGGIRKEAAKTLAQSIATTTSTGRVTREAELEIVRAKKKDELLEQITRLQNMQEESKEALGLDTWRFRQAISSSLKVLKAPELWALDGVDDTEDEVYGFPQLDRLPGADPTWAATLDTLRPPRPRGKKLWEWRKEAPIRPVIFKDTGGIDDKKVHLHLEHRVVQRLLGRFIAQGFVHDDLSRACIMSPDSPVPRVVLLGRLSLYGAGASRLHDEVVPITARWTDPASRKAPLAPYGETAEAVTLKALEDAFSNKAGHAVPDDVKRHLQVCAERDVHELAAHLEERAARLREAAQKKLTERGAKEAKEMVAILEAQQKRILETKKVKQQLELAGMSPVEQRDAQRQFEAEKRYWEKRLGLIDQELVTEPQRIRDVYEVKISRVEPLGLVYLWPRS